MVKHTLVTKFISILGLDYVCIPNGSAVISLIPEIHII